MLNKKQQTAIENLLILADYIKEHAIYSGEMKDIINNSIAEAENLINKKTSQPESKDKVREMVVKSIIDQFDT